MTNMKKLILALVATIATVLSATAQDHFTRSFIAPSVYSLNVSNGIQGITNLNSTSTLLGSVGGGGTNVWGCVFTNGLGNRVMVTNYADITNTPLTFESFNLLQDVSLWPDRNGSGTILHPGGAPSVYTTNTYFSIFIRLVGQSGANAAVNFVFSALPDGVNECTTGGSHIFTVGVTANTTTPVTIMTNFPANYFVGAKKLRLRSIANADTDATSTVTVLNCAVVGFQP